MFYLVNSTTDSRKIAKKISDEVIKANLSPCIQIIPNIISSYKWNNSIETSNEYLISIKTVSMNINLIKKIIKANHNYKIPELISYKINIEDEDYKKWYKNNMEIKDMI